MKTLFSLLAFLFIGSFAFSQTQDPGTVTVNVTGNRINQIVVDNKSYAISNTTGSKEQAVVINDLSNGTHSLEIIRKNQGNRSASTKTSFTLRQGYDLTIDINSDGSVNLSEARTKNWGTGGNKPISTAAYNKLYTATRNKNSSSSRGSFLENEFSNTNKKFTAKQASGLIQLVNSESLRLKLAKLSYTRITDQQNFSLVSALLKSTANRAELNNYIAALPVDSDPTDNGNVVVPMSNQKFQVIYNEVKAETSAADKNYYLSNFFMKDFNYYTSAQAKQLIQLITTETDRFYLSKVAYRGITDRENYYAQVAPLMYSSSNRADLKTYMASYEVGTTNQGMSTVEFNKLYQTVSYQNNYTTRYNSLLAAFTGPGNYFTVTQAKQLIKLVNDETSRLTLAKTVYKALVDPANYTQFNEILSSQSSRNELSNYVAGYANGNGTGIAMSETDFNNLHRSISNSWSSSTKFTLTADAFKNEQYYFTTSQVRQLLLLNLSESDRLSLARTAYDNVVDKANFSQLYDVFNSQASKNELARFVADMDNGGVTTIKTPMTEAEYNSMYRNVQMTFGLGAKMSALSVIFNNETNYFTVEQTRKLIELVSSETNRLELAKSSYNNVTDPANFSQLYNLFTRQESKDELVDFVSKNAYTNN